MEPLIEPQRGESVTFDNLLLALYQGIGGARPWTPFLNGMCSLLQANTSVLVLRQPSRDERGDLFAVGSDDNLKDRRLCTQYVDDPFLNLQPGIACGIADRMARSAFTRTRFYNEVLNGDEQIDVLALNIEFNNGYIGHLRFTRRHGRPFDVLEKSLLMRLYPHLQTALDLFETSRRLLLENNAYINAIDQLTFGVIIINERRHVVRVNETASIIMRESNLLRVVGNYLHAVDPENEALIAQTIQALLRSAPETAALRSLKVEKPASGKSLYLLFKPIYGSAEIAVANPGLAIFMSHDNLRRNVSIETFARLYSLTRAEVALCTELLDGGSIGEVAGNLQISENTARSQLRSVFTKTDTHRQADLLKLILTSLAIIA